MIFVTVGTAGGGIEFTRLVREMDRVAGQLDEDVLIQRGTVTYEPVHARHVRFLRFDEAMAQFRQADLIVGHCGAGTVLNALRFRKPIILVPRRADAGELDTDDHQLELARLFAGVRGVRVVEDTQDLLEAVRALRARPEERPESSPDRRRLLRSVSAFLAGAARSGRA